MHRIHHPFFHPITIDLSFLSLIVLRELVATLVALVEDRASLVDTSQLHSVEVQLRVCTLGAWLIDGGVLLLLLVITKHLIDPCSLLLLARARDRLTLADHSRKLAFERTITARHCVLVSWRVHDSATPRTEWPRCFHGFSTLHNETELGRK